jgi:hypothetical protein
VIRVSFYVGLDLGQSADYTALAVVEQVDDQSPTGRREKRLHLRHLERYQLRTPYPEIADTVARLMADERLMTEVREPWEPTSYQVRPELVVDNTGVGRAVTDLLQSKGLRFKAVTITGGDTVHVTGGSYRVPKRDLVAALEVPFHTGALRVPRVSRSGPPLKGSF